MRSPQAVVVKKCDGMALESHDAGGCVLLHDDVGHDVVRPLTVVAEEVGELDDVMLGAVAPEAPAQGRHGQHTRLEVDARFRRVHRFALALGDVDVQIEHLLRLLQRAGPSSCDVDVVAVGSEWKVSPGAMHADDAARGLRKLTGSPPWNSR